MRQVLSCALCGTGMAVGGDNNVFIFLFVAAPLHVLIPSILFALRYNEPSALHFDV
jgi:hypothetical protein